MTSLKITLAGLALAGAAWAAQSVLVDASRDALVLRQAPRAAAEPDAPAPGAPADDEAVELSEAEIQAELERLTKEAAGTDELEEFVPSKPLAADVAIALPSDI